MIVGAASSSSPPTANRSHQPLLLSRPLTRRCAPRDRLGSRAHSGVRVVRPAGTIIGYDRVDTALTRLSHTLDRSVARPMRILELRTRVAELPVDATIDEAVRGLVVRFVLSK
jgi:hypothetical protein